MTAEVKKTLVRLLLFNLIVIPAFFYFSRPNFFYAKGSSAQKDALPVHAVMPDFQLTAQDGSSFEKQEMLGSLWVADFIFTRCPGLCPMISDKFRNLQETLGGDVRLASFSVEPTYDTPERLFVYAEKFGARRDRWLFLTGASETVRRILSELHLGDGDDPNLHSLRFVLLDKSARVRGYYDSQDTESMARLMEDIRRLRKVP